MHGGRKVVGVNSSPSSHQSDTPAEGAVGRIFNPATCFINTFSQHQFSYLFFALTNFNSIVIKLNYLHPILHGNNISISRISESWLLSSVPNSFVDIPS